jgi:aspartate/methionine/tyrosine aminotransferase
MIDDHFAALALENAGKVLERSQRITRGNLAILQAWVAHEPKVSWVKPGSGTTALLKYDLPISSRDFCVRLLQETGVMLTPGSALNMEGYVRIGYANGPDILKEGLSRISSFLSEQGRDDKTYAPQKP